MNNEAWSRATEGLLALLELMPDMEASGQEWAQVERILTAAVESAIDRRDAPALIAAVRDVTDLTGEYHSPARIGEQPPRPPQPPPPTVLERIPRIVEKVGRIAPPPHG
ncbi:CATRA system-associated protein [Streptomyces cyaneofuscatus]|uniref:CATRA system-associated protein n=1 Tax=Streptomyces cyaneofuscatus TaxID=66883 RepID=UPI00364FA27D